MLGKIIVVLFSFVSLLFLFFLIDAVMFFMMRAKAKWTAVIAAGTIYFVLFFAGMSLLEAKGSMKTAADLFKSRIEQTTVEMTKNGATPEEAAMIAKVAGYIMPLVPGMLVCVAIFMAFINCYFVETIYIRFFGGSPVLPPFQIWTAGEAFVWVLNACVAAALLKNFIKIDAVFYAAVNIILVMLFVYFLQGLSVVSFYFTKYNVPVLLQAVLFIFILVPYLKEIILLTGLLDTWFNFRKLNKVQ